MAYGFMNILIKIIAKILLLTQIISWEITTYEI